MSETTEISEKKDGRKFKTQEQLEILAKAREKANAVRKERGEVTKKLKAMKEEAFQEKREMVAKMEKDRKPKHEPESDEEPDVVVIKKKKKQKIIYESESDEEPPIKKQLEHKPAETVSRMQVQEHLRKIQQDRLKSLLFG